MRHIASLTAMICLLTCLTACEPNPAIPPGAFDTDPKPLVITPDTYGLTFYGTNFAPDAYLAIYGQTFTYICDGSEYYGHTCPLGSYVMYSFEDAYDFFSSFKAPPYTGRFRIFNVGLNGVNDGGRGDDPPSGYVAFSVQ